MLRYWRPFFVVFGGALRDNNIDITSREFDGFIEAGR